VGVNTDWPLAGRDDELRQLSGGSARSGVLLAGDAGVGKTRLLRETLALEKKRGTPIRSVVATRSASAIEFGALAHLLPAVDAQSRLQLLQHLMAKLTEPHERLLLGVDDAHLLDEGSATLVHMLARTPDVRLIVTIRRGEPASDAVTALWKDGLLDRLDLPPLDPDTVRRLAESSLGGPLASSAAAELVRLSGGNPQFLREILLNARHESALIQENGAWYWNGHLGPGTRISELVAQRLDHLDPDERELVYAIALSEPLALPVAERLADMHMLESLEQHSIVAVEGGTVRLTHPLIGEVLRASPGARTTRLRRDLADATEAAGAVDEDLIRYVLLRLDSNGSVSAERLASAIALAETRFDHATVERFARVAIDAGGGFDPRLSLARALSGLRRTTEADEAFRKAAAVADSVDARMRLVVEEAQHRFFQVGDREGAAEQTRQATIDAPTPDWRDKLDSLSAVWAGMRGDFGAGIALGEEMHKRTDASASARVTVYIVSTIAQIMSGQIDAAAGPLQEALALEPEAHDASLPPYLLRLNMVHAAANSGRLEEAEQSARAAFREAAERGIADVTGASAVVLGEVLALRGLIREAADAYADGRERCAEYDPFGTLDHGRAMGAVTSAWLGNAGAAEGLLGAIDPERRADDVRVGIHADRAAAWVLALGGDVQGASEAVVAGAHRAIEGSHLVWGGLLLHDATRLGAPEMVVDYLISLAGNVDGALVRTLADHTVATVALDADAIYAAASELRGLGALLLAAEAYAQSAGAFRDLGLEASARRSGAQAASLLDLCGDCSTPALIGLLDPLTRREREVAMRAARGAKSSDIAAQLGIGVRTVDNHLGSVYSKLDVDGRRQLAELLP